MAETSQDPGASVTYNDDWTAHLAKVGRTISTATVTASDGAVVTNKTSTTTGVMFRLAVNAVTGTPKDITTTTTVTLDNGDVDVRHHTIQVTNT